MFWKKTSKNSRPNDLNIIAFSVGVSLLILLILFFFLSLAAVKFLIPLRYFNYMSFATICVSSLFGGFLIARIKKERGFAYGLIPPAALFLIFTATAYFFEDNIVYSNLLIKLSLMSFCGAFGGIMGVNKKTKLK